jgi:hypothetical protein
VVKKTTTTPRTSKYHVPKSKIENPKSQGGSLSDFEISHLCGKRHLSLIGRGTACTV